MKWDGEWHITYEVFRDLGLAFAAVLVAQYAELPFPIAAQSIRTKPSMPALVVGFDRLLVLHGNPDRPINLLHRLDLRLKDPHLNPL